MSNIKKKIAKCKSKYKKFENDIKDKGDKYISYEILKQFINNNNDENEEGNNNTIKNMIIYWILCLKEKNNNSIENITKIISDIKQIKDKEKDIDLSNISQTSNEKNIAFKIIKKEKFSGIRNLKSICYLNSIVQQLFMILNFKYSILDANDNKESIKTDYLDDDNFLHQLQKLFTYLSFTSYGEVIPKDLVLSIKDNKGEPLNPTVMQDCQEFFTNFCDMIEKNLNNTKYKYLINNLFIGKICNIKTCDACKNITYDFEEFKNLKLEIQNSKDVNESLDKYIKEEIIDDFKCSNCNKKVKLRKKSLLSNLPNILVIHLNRIMWNMEGKQEKINSKFIFPIELDLKKYCAENQNDENKDEKDIIYKKKEDYYKYNLRGIIIHNGGSNGGHYTNIIKGDGDKWYKFNDSKVKQFDIKKIEEECYGGINKNNEIKKKNAYLLF